VLGLEVDQTSKSWTKAIGCPVGPEEAVLVPMTL
jgi:hypothetical protein